MKKSILLLVGILLLATFLTGCATSVKVTIERPAELDLNGAKTVGMLPFQAKSTSDMGGRNDAIIVVMYFFGFHDWYYDQDDEDRKQLADLLTRKLQEELSKSTYLELVDSNRIQYALSAGSAAPCDVYLTGAISRFETSVETIVRERSYAEGKKQVPYYFRRIEAELMYQVVDAHTNRVVSYKTVPINLESHEVEARESVDSVYSLGRSTFEELAYTILRQLQPYTVDKYLYLLSDPHKDEDMKYADEVVKAGSVEYAKDLFMDLYVKRGYMEAGYNAAILLEALGDLEGARDLMQEVFDIFKDTRALKAVEDINAEIESANKLQYQNEIRRS